MTATVAYGTTALSIIVALFAAWHTWRGFRFSNPLFYSIALVQVVLVAVTIGGIYALARTSRDVDGVLFVSYLLTVVVIPPAAVFWGLAEQSRWGTGVVAIAMATVAVLMIRLQGIWTGAYV